VAQRIEARARFTLESDRTGALESVAAVCMDLFEGAHCAAKIGFVLPSAPSGISANLGYLVRRLGRGERELRADENGGGAGGRLRKSKLHYKQEWSH
jgi:hypothetical protein